MDYSWVAGKSEEKIEAFKQNSKMRFGYSEDKVCKSELKTRSDLVIARIQLPIASVDG